MENDRANILMVDDHPENLLALEAILEDLGQHLVRAKSGREALKALLHEDFAVILLDVQMPELDGFETARLIRGRPRSQHTPIIFLTAFDKTSMDVSKGYSIGAVDYIFKPVTPEILRSKVAVFVDIHKRQRELAQREQVLASRVRDLEEQEEALRKAYDHLEALIKERTAELERANESLVRLNLDLNQRNEDLDEFAYVASHDLQEPLRTMMTFADLLSQDIGDDLSEDARYDLQAIIQSAQRMQRLVQAVLALSRYGRQTVHYEEIKLDECVDEALAALAGRIEDMKPEIVRQALPAVNCDRMLLNQLYQNLIGNALKFCDHTTPRIELTADQQDSGWVFGVRDNGIGINPQYSERIFKPFKRLKSAQKHEGTGIGLSICKKAVERHGGKIWVESSVGEGAHFKFTLFSEKAGVAHDDAASSQAGGDTSR